MVKSKVQQTYVSSMTQTHQLGLTPIVHRVTKLRVDYNNGLIMFMYVCLAVGRGKAWHATSLISSGSAFVLIHFFRNSSCP